MGWALLAATAGGAVAQTVADQSVPETNLDIPQNLQIFGKLDPNIRKPTAVVNDTVITQTDVDQRLALTLLTNGGAKPPAEQLDQIKLQILRQLIDETLEVQEAKANKITITPAEIDQSVAGVAKRAGQTPEQFRVTLRKAGTSERSLRQAIEGELAWNRYLRRNVEPFVNVGDEEVKAIIDRIQAAKGTEEFNLHEIYLSANDGNREQVAANARQIIQELQKGQQPFEFYARSYSEASTKSVGGDLGWIRLATLPQPLAEAAQSMQVGQVAGPIPTPGGFSILYLTDKRTIGAADPRDARLSLKQLTIKFPANTTMAQAQARAGVFAKALESIQGCGSVEKVAQSVGAEVVDNDSVPVRSVPDPRLQQILLSLKVGQATPPFGSPEEGVRSLVICGRDDPQQGAEPSANQIQGQLEQQRVNLRAQSKLRDLRRDAVIEYR